MKPKILITGKFKTDDFGVGGLLYAPVNYANAIICAGGTPFISAMADAEEYADLADGILFTGSACDITPSLYGQECHGSVSCDTRLDDMELKLFQAFFRKGKPIFGICRGVQLINVALGGTLIQDIPQEVPDLTAHAAVYRKETYAHRVTSPEGSLLHRLFGDSYTTNSYHHQAISVCGEGLLATAVSQEGIIEAVEHKTLPIFGVQWHPERMVGQEQRELTDMMPLFHHFITLAKQVRNL